MQWDDLRFFLAVAKTGSISSGARKLDVQHSTVSRRIRALEQRLKTRLLERIQGGYELTPAGEQLKAIAQRIENEIFEVDQVLDDEIKLSGPLRVATLNNVASTVLMPIFKEFCEKHPDVELHINVSNQYLSLYQREADVAIRLTNEPPDTLIGTRLVTVASAVYGNKEYLKQCKQAGHDPEWIGVTCCNFHKTWTKRECGNRTFNFYSDDTILTLASIREGMGLSFLPCFMGDSDPQLERFMEPNSDDEIGLWLLYHPDLKNTVKIREFKSFMESEIQNYKHLFA
ncbi:MAG: LysR family transcriptional regulator [Bdellovibrionaceae bacterium]|nr:LysR family transcriptional regulator [Bdellovibrionales bacterium]MCB9085199.1 LysR family transcriptional regulator [Pseudobdellovibrionaceae bacterium]